MPASVPPERRPAPGSEPGRPRVATPTDVSAAIEQRRRKEQGRRRIVAGAVALLLVLALLAAWLVRFSSFFAARSVQVNGTSRVSAEQVLQAAEVPMGTPLVTLDAQPVGERVVSALAAVERVRVHTRLPNTVVIDVTERRPVYQRKVGTQYQLVDASGVVFAVQSRPDRSLLVATTPGVDNRLLASVATVVAALPDAVRTRVQVVQAPSPDQVALQLDKGQSVLWGSADASAEKAKVLQVLLAGTKATVFDVTSPGSPSTR